MAARIKVTELPWDRFLSDVDALDQAVSALASLQFWTDLLDGVREIILPALDRPAIGEPLEEDYLMGTVRAFNEPMDASMLKERVDLVTLFSGEKRRLTRAAGKELMSRSFSYYADDLVILTWDRAFIYEPRLDSDVADVIKVANAQWVEFR